VILSARNVPGVATAQAGSINTYDIMKYSTVVATKAAAEKIQEVYA
jgi:large subunit ribosomal protein L4